MFQMWRLLERVYFLNKQRTKYVAIYLDENLTPQVKLTSSSRTVVLNQMQWFILVTFKNDIPKIQVHDLGDNSHTLSMYCGRYIRIGSETSSVFLSKSEWSYLMKLSSFCIDRQIIKLCSLHDELIEWRSKCLKSKAFCTPPQTSAIDFETLYDEIMYKKYH